MSFFSKWLAHFQAKPKQVVVAKQYPDSEFLEHIMQQARQRNQLPPAQEKTDLNK